MLISVDPILKKMQDRFREYGFTTSIPKDKLDFEHDYRDSVLMGSESGIGNLGTLCVDNSAISYINILKKQEMAKCNFAVGGYAGMGVHLHSWLKLRFFLSFPTNLNIGPLKMGTITTIKKGLFKSEVEDYEWSGYQKLTTLPPGILLDNVADALDNNELKKLMKKGLLRERIVFVSRYEPKTKLKGTITNSNIVVESKWKLQKDTFPDMDTIKMYETIAKILRQTIQKLQYHLK